MCNGHGCMTTDHRTDSKGIVKEAEFGAEDPDDARAKM